jgi:hypothetical protein
VSSNNVLRRGSRPTDSSYQEAVKRIIDKIGAGLTDQELAQRLGCSAGTVSNARNKKGNLCAVTLANIGHEFGADAVLPFAALFECLVIPRRSSSVNDFATIAGLSHVAGDWIERLRDGHRCKDDTKALAAALGPLLAALNAIVKEAEMAEEGA